MKLGEIIKKFREKEKLSMDKFSEKSGITKGYISMLEKNEHPKSKKPIIPTEETLLKVAKGMGVDIDFILNKLDPDQEIQINIFPDDMLNTDDISAHIVSQTELTSSTLQKITYNSSKLEHKRQLKVLDYTKIQLDEQNSSISNVVELFEYDYYDQPASAGTGQYLNDVNKETVELPVNIDADFVIPIYGDSMEPEYHSGDYAFIKSTVNLNDGQVGVFDLKGDAYIKQLIIDGNKACLHSFNEEYKDIPIDEFSDFRIIGKVVGSYSEK